MSEERSEYGGGGASRTPEGPTLRVGGLWCPKCRARGQTEQRVAECVQTLEWSRAGLPAGIGLAARRRCNTLAYLMRT